MNTLSAVWENVPWPYNSEVKDVTWRLPVTRGFLYLREVPHFEFTQSCGANSDDSWSGCFYGDAKITTVEQAKAELLRRRCKGGGRVQPNEKTP